MARKPALRKTLPKDFEKTLEQAEASGNYDAVHAILEASDLDARGGYSKVTVLTMGQCTEKLARWVVARGTKVDATDTYGRTALYQSARARFHHKLAPAVLIELGANIHHRDTNGATPLHFAADGKNLAAVELLMARGAEVDALDDRDLTPMEYALERLSNIVLVDMVPVARALLSAGARVGRAPEFVKRAADTFEFHRAGFAKDSVEEAAAAARTLCEMFGVTPPAPRKMHDGVSPIVATSTAWQDQHAELWELLVPSKGACQTVQGEVVRIAGRVGDELHRNGGANWNADYDAMLHAFCAALASHTALSSNELADCAAFAKQRSRISTDKGGGTARMAELSVKWVALNPTPVPLPPPSYKR
ncbi:ankyrin repeat domain-containing protein [soil metagenome]